MKPNGVDQIIHIWVHQWHDMVVFLLLNPNVDDGDDDDTQAATLAVGVAADAGHSAGGGRPTVVRRRCM